MRKNKCRQASKTKFSYGCIKAKTWRSACFQLGETQAEIAISLQFIEMNHVEMIQTELFSELA